MKIDISEAEHKALGILWVGIGRTNLRWSDGDWTVGAILRRLSEASSDILTLPGPDGHPNVRIPVSEYDFEHLTADWDA